MRISIGTFIVLSVIILSAKISAADLAHIGHANYMGNEYSLIYEDNSIFGGLVWLDYTNSKDTWQNQMDWANNLGVELSITLEPGYITNIEWDSGWRLPVTDESKINLHGPWNTDVGDGTGYGWGGTDQNGNYEYYRGYNMINSEMGNFFYKSLGYDGYLSTDGVPPESGEYGYVDHEPFSELLSFSYWSSTDFSPNLDKAWNMMFSVGNQNDDPKNVYNYALAVHPGIVSLVPLPGAVWLLGSGMIGLMGIRRRTRNS